MSVGEGRRRPVDRGPALGNIGKILLWAIVSGIAVLIIGYLGSMIGQRDTGRQKILAKQAIDRCLQDQDDAFNSIEQHRFARMACNKMRNDYRQRYRENL